MSKVTIEVAVAFVRVHKRDAVFGEGSPYHEAFSLVQVEPGVFEAKIALDRLRPEEMRDFRKQMRSFPGFQYVFYWRYKEDREPYKVIIR